MIRYRTIDGKACSSRTEALNYDINYIKSKNIIMHDGYYNLYKINNIDELIPLIYARYKIVSLTNFPYYIIENKQNDELTLVTVSDLNEAIKTLLNKRR